MNPTLFVWYHIIHSVHDVIWFNYDIIISYMKEYSNGYEFNLGRAAWGLHSLCSDFAHSNIHCSIRLMQIKRFMTLASKQAILVKLLRLPVVFYWWLYVFFMQSVLAWFVAVQLSNLNFEKYGSYHDIWQGGSFNLYTMLAALRALLGNSEWTSNLSSMSTATNCSVMLNDQDVLALY